MIKATEHVDTGISSPPDSEPAACKGSLQQFNNGLF